MTRYLPVLALIACSKGLEAGPVQTPTGVTGTGSAVGTPTGVNPLPTRGLPEGMLAYVETDGCPPGWSEWADGVGRAIVSAANGDDVGLVTGVALTDVAPRPHGHAASGDLSIPGAGISGLSSCCNGSPGASGSYPVAVDLDEVDPGIPTVALTLCRKDSAGDADLGHSLPAGVAAFFDRAECPTDMVRLANSGGYFVVPTDDPTAIGQAVGTPLNVGEDRTHSHSTTLSVDVPIASLAAASGGNNDTARAGLTEATATSDEATSGLPTIGALLCQVFQEVDTAGGQDEELPGGAIVWSVADCPSGWVPDNTAVGRIAIGAPDGVAPGTTHGDALLPLTRPSHGHAGTGSISIPVRDVALASGCCHDTNGGNGTLTVSATAEDAVLDLPFLHLRACVRP